VIKTRKVSLAGLGEGLGEKRNAIRVLMVKSGGKKGLKELSVDRKIMLK
jgi:hypothetical protein